MWLVITDTQSIIRIPISIAIRRIRMAIIPYSVVKSIVMLSFDPLLYKALIVSDF